MKTQCGKDVPARAVCGSITASLQKRLHRLADNYIMRFLMTKKLDSLWQLC
jgi:hypothetical protein